MMVEIWGKPQCPYCEQAKAICDQKQIPFTYKQLDKDFTREEIMEEFPGARTFPQIKIDGQAIGGYTDLVETFRGTEGMGSSGPTNPSSWKLQDIKL